MFFLYRILFFILLLIISLLFYRLIFEQRIPYKTLKIIYRHAKTEVQLRADEERKLREEVGRKEKDGFLSKFDHLIARSGITSYIKFLNTEIYITMITVVELLCIGMSMMITHSILLTLCCSLVLLFLSYLLLYIMSGMNYKKTETNLLEFANLLENYSKTNDDIITILYKIYPYLLNPLHDAVEACVYEARSTGNVSNALMNLENKIEHDKFKEIIRNIEICSRYEANYDEIIKDSRKMLRDYIAAREERKALLKNSRIEMTIIIFCCSIIISMLDGFSTIGIVYILFHSMIGNALLGYCVIVLFLTFWVLLAIDK